MKRIGLIDYYIDEYHARVAPKNAGEMSKILGLDYKVTYLYL